MNFIFEGLNLIAFLVHMLVSHSFPVKMKKKKKKGEKERRKWENKKEENGRKPIASDRHWRYATKNIQRSMTSTIDATLQCSSS